MPKLKINEIVEQLKLLATDIVVEDKPGAPNKADMLRQAAELIIRLREP